MHALPVFSPMPSAFFSGIVPAHGSQGRFFDGNSHMTFQPLRKSLVAAAIVLAGIAGTLH